MSIWSKDAEIGSQIIYLSSALWDFPLLKLSAEESSGEERKLPAFPYANLCLFTANKTIYVMDVFFN